MLPNHLWLRFLKKIVYKFSLLFLSLQFSKHLKYYITRKINLPKRINSYIVRSLKNVGQHIKLRSIYRNTNNRCITNAGIKSFIVAT